MSFSPFSLSSARDFARTHFLPVQLGDARLARRAGFIGERLALQPGASIPALFDSRAAVKAAYAFFDHPSATPEALQAGHVNVARSGLRECASALLIEDTTELSYAGREPIEGLGPIANGTKGQQGFYVHTVVAVRVPEGGLAGEASRRQPLELFGIAHQEMFARKARPKGEPKGSSDHTRRRARESQIWERSTQSLGPAPRQTRWVRVADREADIYDSLRRYVQHGHGFVVRAKSNRCLEDTDEHLFERLLKAATLGSMSLELRARPGLKARTATLSVAAIRVELSPPERVRRADKSAPPIAASAIRVWENNPPQGVEPLEWKLLADARCETFDQAREAISAYTCRWIIEEFHKALKTGMGAEKLQLESAARLFAAVALMGIVALRLIDLRERMRLCPQAPASASGLTPLQLQILAAVLKRELRTILDTALAVARLGGHMNRRNDGPPGWKTLWIGMRRLDDMTSAVQAVQQTTSYGE